ncbi:MAG: ferrochelatase [Actinobacteria bacterium]|nr:ferrochelatase [Actinomycetota bacterium]
MTASNLPDALLLVAFGGPEGPEDVTPFLQNVTAGRDVPADRLAEVAQRYLSRGGKSPGNDRMRALLAGVQTEVERRGLDLPVVWGNRNWHPFIEEAVTDLEQRGLHRVAAWFSSPNRSYSTCRQYLEQISAATENSSVTVERLRPYFDHPGCIEPAADRLREALLTLPADLQDEACLLFSAHSLPLASANACAYVDEINEAARLIAERVSPAGQHRWEVVWQSRSGSPQVPWLVPDVGDRIDELAGLGVQAVAVSPVGFPVGNFEVEWDLDVEAAQRAAAHGMSFARADTIDQDPRFAAMIVDLLLERFTPGASPAALGNLGIAPDICPGTCCPPPPQRPPT